MKGNDFFRLFNEINSTHDLFPKTSLNRNFFDNNVKFNEILTFFPHTSFEKFKIYYEKVIQYVERKQHYSLFDILTINETLIRNKVFFLEEHFAEKGSKLIGEHLNKLPESELTNFFLNNKDNIELASISTFFVKKSTFTNRPLKMYNLFRTIEFSVDIGYTVTN